MNQYPAGPPLPPRPSSTPWDSTTPPALPPRVAIDSPDMNATPPLGPRPTFDNTTRTSVSEIGTSLSSTHISTGNIFSEPISVDEPLSQFSRVNHEVPLPVNISNNNKAIETNKFYGNMLLGGQANATWTHPYSLWWSKDSHYGIAVAYIQDSQKVFSETTPSQYFFSPIGIKSFVFSATAFNSATDMSLGFSELKHLSTKLELRKSDSEYILLPLVQGMGFVTAIYYNLTPTFYSAVGFRSFSSDVSPRNGIKKYRMELENGVTWLLFVTIPENQSLSLNIVNGNTIVGDQCVSHCVFQISADTVPEIDSAAGCYPVLCTLDGSIEGSTGRYSLNYTNEGSSNSGTSLMYALPHHVDCLTSVTSSKKTSSTLDSTVRGKVTGYLTNSFQMEVTVPHDLEFQPYTTVSGKGNPSYSEDVKNAVRAAAADEAKGDVFNESNLDSMYTAGKVLAKYAWILYCCQYVIQDSSLVCLLMPKLKDAMARFTGNKQILPLQYDRTWGGIISSGESSQDFGNSYYNDHHFHYSYHVIAAAILAKVDKDAGNGDWLNSNKAWVENLIRDYANPNEADPYFPVFRSFDWFNGNSWAKGLFESGDGKDEESSSEDVNSAYALKLWGLVTGNSDLESIGNLQLGVLNKSLNHYFLYSDDNTTMPTSFIQNRVSGILFENKVDHTTYFGNNLEYIQMIHAIPITPASSFIRSPTFVEKEWEQKLKPIVDNISDGWKGIIMLNVALYDPNASYSFFSGSDFSNNYLDNGQSKTWSLTYSGAFA